VGGQVRERLLLFDIDGTLIDSGRAGTRALDRAFDDLFNRGDAFRDIKMAGKTDSEIIREGLKALGISNSDGEVDEVVKRYILFLEEEIENPWRKVKPGVFEILNMLRNDGIPLGLLTGNLEAGARIKLRPFDLNEYFPTGAFGDDSEDRNELLPVALRRFFEMGVSVKAEKCIVVGDTPRDVRCAKIHGAHCVAVTTGPYNEQELEEAGSDLVVTDLKDRERFLDFVHSIFS
jgi:phosphoglycolate phosphatase-like HAD superfamily hydrolase